MPAGALSIPSATTCSASTQLSNDIRTGPLARTGVYTLLVEGDLAATGTTPFSFTPYKCVDLQDTIALGNPVSGSLANPGDRAIYTIHVTQFSRVWFDSLTNQENMRWSLSGPGGVIVQSRAFDSSDGMALPGDPALDLTAGTYTLTVDGEGIEGTATGPFGFRLLDLANVTTLTPGTSVSGTLTSANASVAYKFSATAGQRFNLDVVSTSGGNPVWRLLDPQGRLAFGPAPLADVPSRVLARTGTYTLLIEGDIADEGSTTYEVNVVPNGTVTLPPLIESNQLTFNSNTSGNLDLVALQPDTYRFTLTSSTKVMLDTLKGGESLRWSLEGPRGTISSYDYMDADEETAFLDLVSGDYALTILAESGAKGPYSFRLLDLTQSTALPIGTPLEVEVDDVAEAQVFRFNGTAGQKLFFDLSSETTSMRYRLIDPTGEVFFYGNDEFESSDATVLARTGQYTLVADGPAYNGGASGIFTLNVRPVTDGHETLALNTTILASIAVPGQKNEYEFELLTPKLLMLDVLFNIDDDVTWKLVGPRGEETLFLPPGEGPANTDSAAVLNLSAGTYTLIADGRERSAPNYMFRMADLSVGTTLTFGAPPIETALNPGSQMDVYRFQGTAGQYLDFNIQATMEGSDYLRTRLIDPFGERVEESDQLLATGTYTLIVEGYYHGPGTDSWREDELLEPTPYTLSVVVEDFEEPAPLPTGTPMEFGDQLSGTINGANPVDYYTFTIDEDQLVYFDSKSYNNLDWVLHSERGTTYLEDVNGSSTAGQTVWLTAGTYALQIVGDDSSGSYNFEFIDLSDAPLLSPSSPPIEGEMSNPANQTHAYRFAATAGTEYVIDFRDLTESNFAPLQFHVFDPLGRQIDPDLFDEGYGELTAGMSGNYTIVIDVSDFYVSYYSVNLLEYSLLAAPKVETAGASFNIGATVGGTIVNSAQTATHAFTVPAATRIYVDGLTSQWGFEWSLANSDGEEIASDSLAAGDWVDVPAGNYVIRVSSYGPGGAYSFRVFDLATATTVTPGTPKVATLETDLTAHAYKLTATAGDQFSFDAITGAGDEILGWRLINPFGYQIFAGDFVDIPMFMLKQTGDYTLLVESYGETTDPVDYSFNIVSGGHVTPSLPEGPQIAVDTPVVGAINMAVRQDEYHFELATATRVVVEILANNPTLNWTLTGPGGVIVSNEKVQLTGSRAVSLAAGAYTITFDRSAPTDIGYYFKVLDIGAAVAHTPGTPRQVTLSNATPNYAAFTFDAALGEHLLLDRRSGSGPGQAWWLLGPDGRAITTHASFNRVMLDSLPQTGTYTLILERDSTSSTPTMFNFDVRHAANQSFPLTLGQEVQGTLDWPLQTDTYEFTIGTSKKVYLDLLNSANCYWALIGPTGTVVPQMPLANGNGYSRIVDLSAGTYQLKLIPNQYAEANTPYKLRLVDVAAEVDPYTPGESLSGTLTPAQGTHIRSFTGNAGAQFYFQYISYINGTEPGWTLIDPAGNTVFSSYLRNERLATLPLDGTYYLLIEGSDSATTDVTYEVKAIPAVVNRYDMEVGIEVSGSLVTPSQRDVYKFTLAQRELLLFDALSTQNTNLSWTLTGPSGVIVDNDWLGDNNIDNGFLDLAAGEYTVTISGSSEYVGPYRFQMVRPASAQTFTLGQTTPPATLDPSSRTHLYKFTAAVNDPFYFQPVTGSGVYYRLVDPTGATIFTPTNSNQTFVAPKNGTYLLMVEYDGSSTTPQPYTFRMQPVVNGQGTLLVGDTISSDISHPGQSDIYTLTLENPAVLYFDPLTGSSMYWSVTGPNGMAVAERSFSGEDASGALRLDLAAGTYKFKVNASGASTPAYSFSLINLAVANPLTLGVLTDGSLEGNNETDRYTFTATAGQSFFFGGTGNVRWRVIDPDGVNVFNPEWIGNRQPVTLTKTGTYMVLIEGQVQSSPQSNQSYSIFAQNLSVGAPMSLGTNYTSTTRYGVYSLSLPTAKQVIFDALVGNSSVSWTLKGPHGTVVDSRTFAQSDGNTFLKTPILDLIAGDYTLTVFNSNSTPATSPATFRLLDPSTASTFTPVAATTTALVSGSLSPGSAIGLHNFTAAPGDSIIFDARTPLPGQTLTWRLLGPNGQLVDGPQDYADAPRTILLPYNGQYTFVIEGRPGYSTTQSYSFDVIPNGTLPVPGLPAGTTISFGSRTQGSLANSSAKSTYRFMVPADALIHIDAQTNNQNLKWTLEGPRGVVVNAQEFSDDPATDLVWLPAGEYAITISSTQSTQASFSFQVLDLSQAPLAIVNTEYPGGLDPTTQSDAYRFVGTTGQRVFFDLLARTGSTAPTFRVVDPYGNLLYRETSFDDAGPLMLPYNGTYIVMIEGPLYSNTVANTYNFMIRPADPIPLVYGTTYTTTSPYSAYSIHLDSATRLYFDSLS